MPAPKKIKQDPNNYRIHSDKNKKIIKKSLDELGAGRSVLVDSENTLIAGNGVMEQWGDKPIKIVETDGSELIVVKRNDLKSNDKKRKKLALLDNHASDTSEFDFELVKNDFDSDFLSEIELKEKNGYFQKQTEFENKLLEKMPFPITIVVNEEEFNKWNEIKREINESDDFKAFMKIVKKY